MPYPLKYTGEQVDDLLDKINYLDVATPGEDGLMSSEDKTKLDNIEAGAQENVVEGISLGGAGITPVDKVINIQLDAQPTENSTNLINSGALYTKLLSYYTKAEVDAMFAVVWEPVVVFSLPTASADTMQKIYFVPSDNPETQNVKDEYITIRSGSEGSYTYSWEQIGSTAIDISGKADKDTDAGLGNLAEFDSNGNPVDSGISAADVDKKGSYDENAVVGASEGLIGPNLAGSEQSMVGLRAFSGKNGLADIKQIEGKTVAWNQLVETDSITSQGSVITATDNGDGSFTLNGTTTAVDYIKISLQNAIGFIGGHKYLLKSSEDTSKAFLQVPSGVTSNFTEGIRTAVGSESKSAIWIGIMPNVTLTNYVVKPQIIDLTLLGIDNLTTVAEVEAWLAANVGLKPYYPYDAGSLLNNDADAIVARGRNQWDEEWENGFYNSTTGAKQNESYAASHLRNKTPIPAFANKQYYIKVPSGFNAWAGCYAADGSFLGTVTITAGVFTTLSGTGYISFYVANYGTTYNHNICINLSDPSFNGQYEPYKRVEKPLNLKEIKVKSPNIWDEEWEVGTYDTTTGAKTYSETAMRCKNKIPVFPNTVYFFKIPNGIRYFEYDASGGYLGVNTAMAASNTFTTGANTRFITFHVASTTVYGNNICINLSGWANGRYFPHGILTFNGLREAGAVKDYETKTHLHRKVGNVDLGTLTWTGTNGDWRANTNIFPPTSVLGEKILCSKYTPTASTTWIGMGEKEIGANDGGIQVKDSSYPDATTFQAAMSGVMLNYQLATEEVYELADPFNGVYRVFEGGTEEVVNSHLSAPFLATIAYNEDINERLLDLSKPGFCEGLVDTLSAGTPQSFTFRQSGGDGVNHIKRIKGKSLAWNQFVENGNFTSITGWGARQATVSVSDGIATVTPSSDGGERGLVSKNYNIISGHKYYLAVDVSSPISSSLNLSFGGTILPSTFPSVAANIWCRASCIVASNVNAIYPLYALVVSNTTTSQTIKYRNFVGIDLTLMFGAGNEPSTVAAFEALYPELYYPYNSGKIVNNDAEGLETTGFNQWDGTFSKRESFLHADGTEDSGQYSSGYNISSYIPVIAGQTYYVNMAAGGAPALCFYDADKNFISGIQHQGAQSLSFTIPTGVAFVRDSISVIVTDYCINRSDASRNGEYQPYWKRDLSLKLKKVTGIPEGGTEADRVTIFPDGPAGVGTAQDMFYEENGVAKAKKKVGSADLGTLTWRKNNDNVFYDNVDSILQLIKGTSPNTYAVANLLSVKFVANGFTQILGGSEGIGFYNASNGLVIYSAAYASMTYDQFKTAMNGVMLNFELATPIVYTDLQNADGTPFEMPKNILVDNLGTEKATYPTHADGSPSAPFECDSNYSVGIANLVRRLNALENA